MVMKMSNVADFKKHLSEYLTFAENGGTVEVRKRNVPVARVTGVPRAKRNRTVLGCGKGTGVLNGDVTEPMIPAGHWNMLSKDEP